MSEPRIAKLGHVGVYVRLDIDITRPVADLMRDIEVAVSRHRETGIVQRR